MAGVHAGAARTALPMSLRQSSVYTVNVLDGSAPALQLSESVSSGVWLRAWNKWGFATDFGARRTDLVRAHRAGALLGGCVNCAVLLPYENGLTWKQFTNLATRDPSGNLYQVARGVYHGSISNPGYQKYVLLWGERQIDAGVDVLLMDAVDGDYSGHEGFDLYGLAEFNEYLLNRFCAKQRWSATDRRWTLAFHVDFRDPKVCPDHTMLTFNYVSYLRANGWTSDPAVRANPLAAVWGDPADIGDVSYCGVRNARVWNYWNSALREYARLHGRRVWLAASGLYPGADLHVVSFPEGFPRNREGELLCNESDFGLWRGIAAAAQAIDSDDATPVVVCLGDRNALTWRGLADEERAAWINSYVPEVFAAGLYFGYPVSLGQGQPGSTSATMAAIRRQVRFIHYVTPLLQGASWLPAQVASYTGEAEVSVTAQPGYRRLMAHLIGRNYERTDPLAQTGKVLRVPLGIRPDYVRVHISENASTVTPPWSFAPMGKQKTGLGVLTVTIPTLASWDIVEIGLPRWVTLSGDRASGP